MQAEPIQRIDDIEIFAVGHANRAVRVRQVHPASGVVRLISNRKDVAGKGSGFRIVKIKQRVNGATRFVCVGRPYAHGQAKDKATDENATHTYPLDRDVLSDFLYTADLFHRTLLGWLTT